MMKKFKICLTVLMSFAAFYLLTSGVAIGEITVEMKISDNKSDQTATDFLDKLGVKPSKDVTLGYKRHTDNSSLYGAGSYHSRGTKTFATSSALSRIFSKESQETSISFEDNGSLTNSDNWTEE